MADEKVIQREFNKVEFAQIEELKAFMLSAFNVSTWNNLREQAKEIWPEKIITAVDGLRKWVVKYDKSTKTCECLGVKF